MWDEVSLFGDILDITDTALVEGENWSAHAEEILDLSDVMEDWQTAWNKIDVRFTFL